ncbi:MAG: polysaccharide deacetylase family protein [Oscillospiraceae bacterium]|nr:polysaccharide deacetylase family protein [Oscillospiraceae bacterium]
MKKILLVCIICIFLSGCTNIEDRKNDNNNVRCEKKQESVIVETGSGKKFGWGQGKEMDDKNRPISAIEYQNKYENIGGYFIGEDNNKIYLTFDEGYENGYTPNILDTLKEKQVKAVFFITYDYAKRNSNLIKRMIDEGHVIGNHSYTHPSMAEISIDSVKSEISLLHEYIEKEFGYKMTLFRPPKGEFTEESLVAAKELGYKTVFWSFAYKDWVESNSMGIEKSLKKVTDSAHSGGIYLLHAVSKDNRDILGKAIDIIRDKGFDFEVYK